MLAAPAYAHRQRHSGPRPLDMNRDVNQVLSLLDMAFGPLSDARSRRMIANQASLVGSSPLWWRLSLFGNDAVPGFVWEEAGQIVGNLSLIESRIPGRFLIANVAVHPDYRRRGLATGLMQEAITYIKHRNGRQIVLQVESENQGAINLYRTFGFGVVGTVNQWESATSRVRELLIGDSEDVLVRPIRREEWRAAYTLDRASVEPDLIWPAPVDKDYYKSGLWQTISHFLDGVRTETWVIDAGPQKPGMLAGLASIRSDWGRPQQVLLRFHPGWRGHVERPLLAKTVRRLKVLRRGTVRLNHPASDQIVNRLLEEANYRTRRSLTVMKAVLMPE